MGQQYAVENILNTFLTVEGAYPDIDAPGEGSKAEYAVGTTQAGIQAFCDRPASKYATLLRSLGSKCHVKD
jgi:hypothetical protein